MGKCEKWSIAYRKRMGADTLINNTATAFIPIPNTWRYWAADPFLLEHQGNTYLFAELYDRTALRGVIGCCQLTDSGAGKWQIIINEPFHLSYPFVFSRNGQVYMIPESFRSGKLLLYRAVDFPFHWEQVRTLADMTAVDSTVIHANGKDYLLTFRITDGQAELVLLDLDPDFVPTNPRILSEKEAPNVRPAGNSFLWEGQLVRPTQNCINGYGCGLNFARITRLEGQDYQETIFLKLLPSDVAIRGKTTPEGIHTYNVTEQYEVIDFKEYEFGLVCKLARAIQLLRRRTGK